MLFYLQVIMLSTMYLLCLFLTWKMIMDTGKVQTETKEDNFIETATFHKPRHKNAKFHIDLVFADGKEQSAYCEFVSYYDDNTHEKLDYDITKQIDRFRRAYTAKGQDEEIVSLLK